MATDRQRRDFRHLTAPDARGAPVVSSVFFGYSTQLLSQWCLVDEATALRWKRGEQEPSPQAMLLFQLHRDGRILGPEWQGWSVRGAQLVDPENQSTSQGQLRAYAINYQLLRELMRKLDGEDAAEARARFSAAMEIAG